MSFRLSFNHIDSLIYNGKEVIKVNHDFGHEDFSQLKKIMAQRASRCDCKYYRQHYYVGHDRTAQKSWFVGQHVDEGMVEMNGMDGRMILRHNLKEGGMDQLDNHSNTQPEPQEGYGTG